MSDENKEPVVPSNGDKDKDKEKKKKKTGTKKSEGKTKESRKSSKPNLEETKTEESEQNKEVESSVEAVANDVESNNVANEGSPQRKASAATEDANADESSYKRPVYQAPVAVKSSDVDALRDLDERKLIELKEAFSLFDLDQDGKIDFADLKATYMTLGQENVSDDEIDSMLAEALNPLDFDAFVVLLGYKTIELDPEEVIREALSQWDKHDNGLISDSRIRQDLMSRGDCFTAKEVDWALEDAPLAQDNRGRWMIDYIKFCKTLCGLRKKTDRQIAE